MDVPLLFGSIPSTRPCYEQKVEARKITSNRDAEVVLPEVGTAQYESIEMTLTAEYLAKTFPRIMVTPKAKA